MASVDRPDFENMVHMLQAGDAGYEQGYHTGHAHGYADGYRKGINKMFLIGMGSVLVGNVLAYLILRLG